jgi:hypothetical protein
MTAEERVETLAANFVANMNELFGLDNITSLCKNKQMNIRLMEVIV